MAKILEFKKEEDEMIPVDEWDGECWKTFFEQVCIPFAKESGTNEWEYLANFMRNLLKNG